MTSIRHGVACLLPLMFMTSDLAAASGYLGAEAGFSQGDFGGDATTSLYALNLSGGLVESRYDIGVVLPVLYMRDDAGFSERGLGDAALRAGYGFWRSDDWTGDASLAIKLPTADENKSLGTGEIDVGVFVDVGRQWDTNKLSASLGYIAVGDPSGINYENVVTWSVSAFTRFDRLGAQLALRGQTSMFPDGKDPLDVALTGFYVFSAEYAATFSACAGLSDGSPDGGSAVGLVRWF